jgi:hypothetical protein
MVSLPAGFDLIQKKRPKEKISPTTPIRADHNPVPIVVLSV